MAGKMSDLFGFFKPGDKKQPTPEVKKQITDPEQKVDPGKERKKIYRGDYEPLRQVVLWGWDSNQNPGFLVLYGVHKFKKTAYRANELEADITFTHYYIFNGAEGHLPSFEAVKIWDTYDYSTRKSTARMYYKKDLKAGGYWGIDQKKALSGYQLLEVPLQVPYFEEMTYSDYVECLSKKGIQFKEFNLVNDPGVVLNLPAERESYAEVMIRLLGNSNLYMRKKFLKQLLDENLCPEMLDTILKIGSGEVISGLFLELAVRQNPILLESAKNLLAAEIGWLSETYRDGLKRCASIYIAAVQSDVRQETVGLLRERLPEMAMKLLAVNGKPVGDDVTLEGNRYRKYYMQGYLSEYVGHYVRENGKYVYVRERRSGLYQKNYYSDGVTVSVNRIKDTLQQAEIYGLADVIGKIAYYCDSPAMVYQLKGSQNSKALNYFIRYLRRIINRYATEDEEKFVTAVKTLSISYTNADYLCKFSGNFKYNYFIRYYLYHHYQEKIPSGWNEQYNWMRTDQLAKLQGRYELKPEIWDRHLDDVLEILMQAKIEVVLKAFYFIMDTSSQKESFIAKLPYDTLIKLLDSPYPPVVELFLEAIEKKLEHEKNFDINILLSFMNSTNEKVLAIAKSYFDRTGGKFPVAGLVPLMLLEHFEDWEDLFSKALDQLNTAEYFEFIQSLLNSAKELGVDKKYSKELVDIFNQSLNKMNQFTIDQKTSLIIRIVTDLFVNISLSEFSNELLERIIFHLPLAELRQILEGIDLQELQIRKTSKNMLMIHLLQSVTAMHLPQDLEIIQILEKGTSKLLKFFNEFAVCCEEQLKTRFSTILILMESDIAVLNELGQAVFAKLSPEEQKNLHLILLDSPDQKTYQFALLKLREIYGQTDCLIPPEFIMQMLEHPAAEVRSYISDKIDETIGNLGNGQQELFLYYVRTLLFLPNKVAAGKYNIYQAIPKFTAIYCERRAEVEELLLDLGGSNIINDSEQALVALAKIRKGAVACEG